MARDFHTKFVYARNRRLVGRLAYYTLKLLGVEIPTGVQIGDDFELAHGGFGVVIHPNTQIGDRVKIYPGVTIGRRDIYRPASASNFEGVVIGDDVILSPGAKVLCKEGTLLVGDGSVIGANAVLTTSTGSGEVWAGIPARCIGVREGWASSGQRTTGNAES